MAKLVWPIISDLVGTSVGVNFESVARWWLSDKKNSTINVVCTAVLWALWKLRSELCFLGENVARREGYLEESGSGSRSLESSFQRCNKPTSGKKRHNPEQDERRTSSHRLEMKSKLLKLGDYPSPPQKERELFDGEQAGICNQLILKFLGA